MIRRRAQTVLTLCFVAFSLTTCTRSSSRGPEAKLTLVDGTSDLYDLRDAGPFNPSSAIYFMDGYSDATVKVHGTGETMTFKFYDDATSIAASEPLLPEAPVVTHGVFLAAPPPLNSIAVYPTGIPPSYRDARCLQLLQVISMNMRSRDGKSSLLIGLPYARKYPDLFARSGVFQGGMKTAASYGTLASLTDFKQTGKRPMNGYPARSVFAVFHILETEFGVFFNKKPTVMELQPDDSGKLALSLPPVPFKYALINGPIPLFDINNPDGEPVAEIVMAHHNGDLAARTVPGSWPWQ
jgi:hypothetical protein